MLRQLCSVDWIKEQAEAGSRETAKSHLEHLVEMGRLRTVEVNGHARCAPDRTPECFDSQHCSAARSPDVRPLA